MSALGLSCLIALAEPLRLDAQAVRSALARTAPHSDISVEARITEEGEHGLRILIDRQEFAAVVLAGLIPQPLADAVQQSLLGWVAGKSALARHRAFVAVGAAERQRGHGLVRAQAVALTRLAASLAETVPALALIWTPSGATASPERLAAAPRELLTERWPLDVWIGYRMLRVQRGGAELIGSCSRGAADYFGSEIVTVPFRTADSMEPMKILLTAVRQLIDQGADLLNGQQITVPGARPVRCTRVQPGDGRPSLLCLTAEGTPPPS